MPTRMNHFDKEKQQSHAKRSWIGKVDPDTDKIITIRSYKKKNGKPVTVGFPLYQFYSLFQDVSAPNSGMSSKRHSL